MWAVGAAVAWALLRHWTQAALVALLGPAWLAGEFIARLPQDHFYNAEAMMAGLVGLAFAYLGARRGADDSVARKALGWIGGIVLLPLVLSLGAAFHRAQWPPATLVATAWTLAVVLPLGLAILLRGRAALDVAVAVAWTVALAPIAHVGQADHFGGYLWCALGAVGLAWWGVKDARPERINLAIAGFAIDVGAFFFSNVMDKLGRSASLIGLGLLFIGGGWMLERMRRRLMAHIQPEVSR
jgi:hypothetical protein